VIRKRAAARTDSLPAAPGNCGRPLRACRRSREAPSDLSFLSPCARGWRRGQSYRRKVVSSLRLEGADLLATVAKKCNYTALAQHERMNDRWKLP
jgi:hypothetical protein